MYLVFPVIVIVTVIVLLQCLSCSLLGAQSFTLLNTLRDPTQLRQRQWATRQQHLFFGCPLLSSLEKLISAPNHE